MSPRLTAPPFHARGLTLIEILIVLALLIAIGAMVAPVMMDTLRDRALDSAADVASQQLMLARAHAQSSGRPVEVVYRPQPARMVARFFEADMEGASDGDRRAAAGRSDNEPFRAPNNNEGRGASADNDDDALTWHWARRALPSGIEVRREPPRTTDERVGMSTAESAPPSDDRPIRLAVFMPDGSSLLSSPLWMANGSGRSIKLEVNAWTGLPRVEEE